MKALRRPLAAGWSRLRRSDDGVTAIEYGLICALIAGVLLIGVTAVGTSLDLKFSNIAEQIADAVPAAGGGSSGKGNGKGNQGQGLGNGGPAA
jgi:pilus assembly protein Flp/PilA